MIQISRKKEKKKKIALLTLTYKNNFLEEKERGRERERGGKERYKKSGSRSMNFISNVTIQNEKLLSKVI